MHEHRLLLLLPSVCCGPSMVSRRPGATWSHARLGTLSSTNEGLHYTNPEPSYRTDNCVGSKGTGVTNIAPVNKCSLLIPVYTITCDPPPLTSHRQEMTGGQDPNLVRSRPPPLSLVVCALVGQMLGLECICAITLSTVSTTRGPLGGQNQKGKLGGDLHLPPSWGGGRGDLVTRIEWISGSTVREAEGDDGELGWGRGGVWLVRPIVTKSHT